jgi:predicted secreted Zn-dependent protease
MADPNITEKITYYDVAGKTPEAVRESMNQLRPSDAVGVKRDAVTRWEVRWRLQTGVTGPTTNRSGCQVSSINVRATIEIVLPRLADPAASKELKDRFAVFHDILLAHERTHARIAIAATRQIDSTLEGWRKSEACGYLHSDTDSMARGVVEDANRRNAAFDEATNNGAAEGALFP